MQQPPPCSRARAACGHAQSCFKAMRRAAHGECTRIMARHILGGCAAGTPLCVCLPLRSCRPLCVAPPLLSAAARARAGGCPFPLMPLPSSRGLLGRAWGRSAASPVLACPRSAGRCALFGLGCSRRRDPKAAILRRALLERALSYDARAAAMYSPSA